MFGPTACGRLILWSAACCKYNVISTCGLGCHVKVDSKLDTKVTTLMVDVPVKLMVDVKFD